MKKILIIEDDVFLGDILLQKIKNEGYDGRLMRDGRKGFEEIAFFMPDLILLDILLPNMNGYEILEEKQKDNKIKDIPVIMISNSGQPVEIDRAMLLGVKDYLVKALFNPDELMVKIHKFMEGVEEVPGNPDVKIEKESGLKGKTLLWVEDDKFLSHLIEKKIPTLGCILFHTITGADAFEILKKTKPDIIILDIVLPDMDGYEILKHLKENEETKKIPVILLSNLGQQSDMNKGEALGANKFIIKASYTFDQIIEQIVEVLESVKK